jgi:DNA-binding NarL/FixJ family response regulator
MVVCIMLVIPEVNGCLFVLPGNDFRLCMVMRTLTVPPPAVKTIKPPTVPRASIAIVDGQPSSRIGISHFIVKLGHWDVIWTSSTAEEAMEKVSKQKPDLMILEIDLHGKDGLEFIKHLKPLHPDLKILVHSTHSEEFYAERCVRAGAMGYLHKMDPMGRFEKAVETVLSGGLYVSSRVARQAIQSLGSRNGKSDGFDSSHVHGLTDREFEILQLIAKGHSCQDTADKLHISPRTVQVHRNNIRLKIGLDSALQLHAYAVRFCLDEECDHCGKSGPLS